MKKRDSVMLSPGVLALSMACLAAGPLFARAGDLAPYPATVADDSGSRSYKTSERVVDGRTEREWDLNGPPGYVVLDLGENRAVGGIRVFGGSGSSHTLVVEGSRDGEAFATLSGAREHTYPGSEERSSPVLLPVHGSARFVKVQVLGDGGWNKLYEVQVLPDPDAPDLVVTDMTCEPGSPLEGADVVFAITIRNDGRRATSPESILSATVRAAGVPLTDTPPSAPG